MAFLGKKNEHNKKQSEQSLELGNLFDMDELVGDIINEDAADTVTTAFIPSKDSDDDKIPTEDDILDSIPMDEFDDIDEDDNDTKKMQSPIKSNINANLAAIPAEQESQPTPNTMNRRIGDAIDDLDVD
eukprot:226049_1